MYSFLYDESETSEVWPNDMSLSAFSDGNSNIVISQIFHQLFDGVREQMIDLKDNIQTDKSQLTDKMNKLLTTLMTIGKTYKQMKSLPGIFHENIIVSFISRESLQQC